jgi:hypothetical protein
MKASDRIDSKSMNASFNGDAYHVEYLEGYSICASWTETSATLAGTLKLQASNNGFTDNVNNNENPNAVWVDITGSAIAVSGSGSQFWNVSDVYYKAFRIVWTRTSGQGTFAAYIHAKGVQ